MMGPRTRATRRRAGGAASTSASTSDDGGDATDDDPRAMDDAGVVDDDDAGCKTPERVAPSADDVRLDNRNFPARFARRGRDDGGWMRARGRARAGVDGVARRERDGLFT